MRSRLRFWITGVALGTLFVLSLSPTYQALAPLVAFLLCVAAIGLVLALVHVLGPNRPGRDLATPADARPADGEVGTLPIRGARNEINPRAPRFGAFQGLEPAEEGLRSHSKPDRGVPRLIGRVAILSLFIGRDGRGWSDEEIARAHEALTRAGVWIEREAIRWDAPVNIDLAATYFVVEEMRSRDVEVAFVLEGNGMAPFEADAPTKALIDVSQAAAKLGFRDAVDMFTQLNARVAADSCVWLLHPRSAGRSMAIAPDRSDLPGVSLAVCYAREANFPEPLTKTPVTDPVTIVHELLHLFGATDKYGIPLRSFPRHFVTSRDVMRLSEERLMRTRIDQLTAMEIGWPLKVESPPRKSSS